MMVLEDSVRCYKTCHNELAWHIIASNTAEIIDSSSEANLFCLIYNVMNKNIPSGPIVVGNSGSEKETVSPRKHTH